MAKAVERYESDGTTAAEAVYDEGAVADGSSTAARRIWCKNASTSAEDLIGCIAGIDPVGENDGNDLVLIAPDVPFAAPGQPTAAASAGAGLEVGDYLYAITFLSANGETTQGTTRAVSTTGGNQRVSLSAIPTGPTGVTKRRIYRTEVGGSDLYMVAELANNSATTYVDSTPDSSLSDPPPTLNASGIPGAWADDDITLGTLAVDAFAACCMRYTVPAGTSQIGNPRRAYVTFEETGA